MVERGIARVLVMSICAYSRVDERYVPSGLVAVLFCLTVSSSR